MENAVAILDYVGNVGNRNSAVARTLFQDPRTRDWPQCWRRTNDDGSNAFGTTVRVFARLWGNRRCVYKRHAQACVTIVFAHVLRAPLASPRKV